MFSQKTIVAAILTALPLVSAFPAKAKQDIKLEARAPPVNTTVTNPKGLAWYSPSLTEGAAIDTKYHCYGGEVSAEPTIDAWASFDDLWESFSKTMLSGGDSAQDVQYIKQAIISTSKGAKVDARVILSMIMQESHGQVNVQCTAGYNCGLLQGPHGSTSFDPSNAQQSIMDMIGQGIYGTKPNNGLVADINAGPGTSWTNNPSPGNVYAAMRIYNSGEVDPSGNLDKIKYGTASYVNDIANRLHGWDGPGGSLAMCNNGTSV